MGKLWSTPNSWDFLRRSCSSKCSSSWEKLVGGERKDTTIWRENRINMNKPTFSGELLNQATNISGRLPQKNPQGWSNHPQRKKKMWMELKFWSRTDAKILCPQKSSRSSQAFPVWHLPAVEIRFVPNDHDLHLRNTVLLFHAIDHAASTDDLILMRACGWYHEDAYLMMMMMMMMMNIPVKKGLLHIFMFPKRLPDWLATDFLSWQWD